MKTSHILPLIAVSLLAWATYHAIGAYLYNYNLARPLMVLGCMLAFLGFWGLMLWSRSRRLKRQAAARRLGPKNAC